MWEVIPETVRFLLSLSSSLRGTSERYELGARGNGAEDVSLSVIRERKLAFCGGTSADGWPELEGVAL